MPTFFEGLKRLLTGQPVFRPGEDADGVEYPKQYKSNDGSSSQPTQQPGQPNSHSPIAAEIVTQRSRPKTIPEAVIEKVETRINGSHMDVSITIQNNSAEQILLDKVLLFGNAHELDHTLRPGESREFTGVYNGPLLTTPHYTHSEVRYRNDFGDYFSAIHNVEFEQLPDKNSYTIRRVRFIPPVKDI